MSQAAGAAASTLRLADGRTLGSTAYGVGDGQPLLYFHGTPGAGVEWGALLHLAITTVAVIHQSP